MATLTQHAQHPIMDKAWDEAIVPALRKRLESESRVLAKRLSAHSVTSGDEVPPLSSSIASRRPPVSTHNSQPKPSRQSEASRPSAIPRPSLSNDAISVLNGVRKNRSETPTNIPGPSKIPPFKRARTHSTPYPFDRDSITGGSGSPPLPTNGHGSLPKGSNGLPTPASSRSATPVVVPPTRIPMASRTRSASRTTNIPLPVRSGSALNGKYVDTRPSAEREREVERDKNSTQFPPSPKPSPDLWAVPENTKEKEKSMRGLEVDVNVQPKIRDEQPPFQINGTQSRSPSILTEDQPRSSSPVNTVPEVESPPQPTPAPAPAPAEFEHWYRGEGRTGGGRNGGKGELIIGGSAGMTAKEMLEIAVVGHRVGSPAMTRKEWRTWNEAESHWDYRQWSEDRVMDENPLTDVDVDSGIDSDVPRMREFIRRRKEAQLQAGRRIAEDLGPEVDPAPESAPQDDPTPPASNGAPAQSYADYSMVAQSQSTSRRQQTAPATVQKGRSSPPTSEPVSTTLAAPPSAGPRSASPVSQTSQSSRQRTQSRPTNGPTRNRSRSAKPARTLQSASTSALADAVPDIPSSEQLLVTRDGSTAPAGNWDDIVLPTVARKMFPDSAASASVEYLGADTKGKRKKGEPAEKPIEPAPGTFGYDATKARIKVSRVGHAFEMSEFGQRHDEIEERSRPKSEAPFASYLPSPSSTSLAEADERPAYPTQSESKRLSQKDLKKNKPVIMVTSPSTTRDDLGETAKKPKPVQIEDEDAGCCKCVIM